MEIHFYESLKVVPHDCNLIHDWCQMHDLWLTKDVPEIHTTQMCMLSNTWILNGYRIFVHQANGIVYEIVLRDENNKGTNAVRVSQNIYAMWASGVFRQ